MARVKSDYYERRKAGWLEDPETRAHHQRERREIEQIDAVIGSLDQLRVAAGSRRRSSRGASAVTRRASAVCSPHSALAPSCR